MNIEPLLNSDQQRNPKNFQKLCSSDRRSQSGLNQFRRNKKPGSIVCYSTTRSIKLEGIFEENHEEYRGKVKADKPGKTDDVYCKKDMGKVWKKSDSTEH